MVHDRVALYYLVVVIADLLFGFLDKYVRSAVLKM